jgi:L-fuconate dehydratase
VAAINAVTPMIIGKDVDALLSDMGRDVTLIGVRLALTLAGAGEGRHAHGDRRRRQRSLGLEIQAGRAAALAVASPDDTGRTRRSRRFPLPDRRLDSRRGTRDFAGGTRWAGAARGGPAQRRLSAYTTTPGWLGYDDAKIERLCREAVADGFTQIKLKVGANVADDIRRLEIASAAVGPDIAIAIDANQRWDVDDAVKWIAELSRYDLAWVEEPTSPDDILGHAEIARQIHPVPVATGEHVANRVIFKQMLQTGALSVLQIDASRVAGVNENIVILLLAAKFGVPVCPHAGGVGLCEAVQHLSMFDYVAVSGSLAGRRIEYVDHLHEHLATPVELQRGRYLAPLAAGAGIEILEDSLTRFAYPDGAAWCDSRNLAFEAVSLLGVTGTHDSSQNRSSRRAHGSGSSPD